MRRSGKNSQQDQQVRGDKKKPAGVEPLRPQTEQLGKFNSDIAKFPEENPHPVLRIHKDGTVLYANRASEPLLKAKGSGVDLPAPAEWRRLAKEVLASGRMAREEVEFNGRIFEFLVVPIADADYVNFYGDDITERKQMAESLSQALAWQEAIFEGSSDAIFITDSDSRFISVNREACELTGYSKQELFSMRIPYLHEEEDLTAYKLYHDRIVAGEEIVSEAKILRKDRTKVDTEFNNRAITICGEVFMHTTARDITERKRAEEALRESEEKYRGLVENSPNIVAIYQEGALKYVNQIMCEKLGWTFQEMTSPSFNPVEKIIPQRFQSLVKENIAKRLRGENIPPYEISIKTRDGSEIPVIVNAQAILYHGKPADEVIHTDITERKKAEERVKAERQRLYDVLETLPVMVCLLTPDYHVAFTNRVFRRKFGEDNGRHCYDYIFGRKGPCEFCETYNVLKTGKPHHWECTSPDGRGIIDVYDFPFTDTDGSPLILEMDIDITEQRRAEQKLLEDQKQLKQLTSQLALTEERERRRIAGELHDQLCQSLALAKIKLDALCASATSRPSEDVLKEVSDTLEKVIDDTRSLMVDISSPILYELGFEAAVAEWLSEQVQDKYGIAAEFQDDDRPKSLDDDVKVLLFRNVRELLINVIKHAHAGKVIVSIRRIDDSIEITVRDNGVGFDFDEAKVMTAKMAKFGLFSIRENVEQLGGHFKIESKPGAGCTATIVAPLKRKGIAYEGNRAAH